ncbi:MAG: pyruvate dehydrogenase complex dihydrolipoamide acetyltransferase [Rhabdochlamydiaceae bacterium]
MPFTVTMPKLSPTMEEGVLAKWHKKEGDYVKSGEVMFEVATDKATIEHTALDPGFVRKILVKEGESALVNQSLAIFTEKQEESIEGYKPEGIEPKQAQESPARAVKEESAVSMSKTPTQLHSSGLQEPAFVPAPLPKATPFKSATSTDRVSASPLAKKVAKQKGVDLSTVQGSGPGGRIMSRDIDLGQPNLPVTFGRQENPNVPPGSYEEESLTPMRKVIGQRLQASKTFIPHFYITQEIRAERLVDAREQLKNMGHQISINDFIIKACAIALREHPQVNSGFNSSNQTIIRFKTVDVAIAVGLDDGLITPIVRYADYKNLGQISQEVKLLAKKAKEGKLQLEEYTGGSFTISNSGMLGISHFVAVINPPQAAILAVGGIEDKAVVEDGEVIAGKVMTLTLSADHRVIDGLAGAKFLKTVQQFLENPAMLVL